MPIDETTVSPSTARTRRSLLRTLVGQPRDWAITPPRPWRHGLSLPSLGPLLVVASCLIWWIPFAGAGGNVAVGLFTGTVAIVLMTWSFVLAVRWRWLEPLFGGLDRMYGVHRWAGVLSLGAMWLHVQLEPEVEGGFSGLLASLQEVATDAAETAEVAFYVLVALGLLRWIPYRFWRLSHKLLGVPFAVAALHTVTSDKPVPPLGGWSLALAGICVVGVGAWVWRVVGRDMLRPGVPHRVVRAEPHERTLELELSPVRRRLAHPAGRFAFIKVQLPGLREPHPFTIASAPAEEHLRFFVRGLGDWTQSIRSRDLIGALVYVEGPYGRFEPFPSDAGRRIVWVAGGVGITPFLSALAALPPELKQPPLLVYAVTREAEATGIEVLHRAREAGQIDLEVVASSEGRRLDAALLRELVGGDLVGAHVAACGPKGLVATVERTAKRLGAGRIESEDFDIRSGVGPSLPRPRPRATAPKPRRSGSPSA